MTRPVCLIRAVGPARNPAACRKYRDRPIANVDTTDAGTVRLSLATAVNCDEGPTVEWIEMGRHSAAELGAKLTEAARLLEATNHE